MVASHENFKRKGKQKVKKMVRTPSFDSRGLKKGAWSEEEDNKLRAYIERYGHWNWCLLPKFAGLARCGKSCRLRWLNYLKPGIKKGNFSKHEEELIIKLHAQLGNKWSAIAAKLPGRTDNEIKNFWHTRIDKRRKRNPAAKKVKGHNNEASSKAQLSEEDKPSYITNISEKESDVSDAALAKLQNSTPLFDTNPSGSVTDSKMDTFLVDQNDHFPPLQEEELFYSHCYSYLSALDWMVADDGHSTTISSDYVGQPVQGNIWSESYVSDTWNSQSETSYALHQVGGPYDPCLEYPDHGMDLFS